MNSIILALNVIRGTFQELYIFIGIGCIASAQRYKLLDFPTKRNGKSFESLGCNNLNKKDSLFVRLKVDRSQLPSLLHL